MSEKFRCARCFSEREFYNVSREEARVLIVHLGWRIERLDPAMGYGLQCSNCVVPWPETVVVS